MTDGFTLHDPANEQGSDSRRLETFVTRMRDTERAFYYPNPVPGSNEILKCEPDFFEDDDEAVAAAKTAEESVASTDDQIKEKNREHRQKWMSLCKREYAKRQQEWRKKAAFRPLFRIVAVVLVALVAIAYFWPLWDLLLDIETDNSFNILEIPSSSSPGDIRKAYREQVKKWHPDRNPDCGQKCRDMTMKIQEAYDFLAARNDEDAAARKESSYEEALLQIRHLVFFRAYDISFQAAEYALLLIFRLIPALEASATKSTVEFGVRGLLIAAFCLIEIITVTGLNPIVIMQVFYMATNMMTSSARKRELERITKRSNFDYLTDFVVFLIPAAGLHISHFLLLEKYPKYDTFFAQLILGVVYVSSHLATFSPNLFDNWKLRKCSVTVQYLRGVAELNGKLSLRYTTWGFLSAEFGFLLNDLFAFTSSLPAVYRLIVIGVHAVYLIERHVFPWDYPVMGRLQRQHERKYRPDGQTTHEKVNSNGRSQNSASSNGAAHHVSGASWRSRPAGSNTNLRDVDRRWLSNLDTEAVEWLDVVHSKYRSSVVYYQNLGKTTLLVTNSTLNDIIVLVGTPPSTSSERPIFHVGQTFHDPPMAKLLYREAGENCVYGGSPPESHKLRSLLMGETYGLHKLRNRDARRVSLTHAGVGHPVHNLSEPLVSFSDKRTAPVKRLSASSTFMFIFMRLLMITLVITCFLNGVYFLPENENLRPIARTSAQHPFSPYLSPVGSQKYKNLLPPDHILNKPAAGVISLPVLPCARQKAPTPVLVPDLWDCLRHLSAE